MTSYSVVLQNSAALLNSSSFCFSLFRQPWLAVDIRPLARSHLSEKSFGLTDVTGDFWLVWDGFSFGERGIAFLFFFYQNNFEVVRLQ